MPGTVLRGVCISCEITPAACAAGFELNSVTSESDPNCANCIAFVGVLQKVCKEQARDYH